MMHRLSRAAQALPLILLAAACGRPEGTVFQGYVEGDFLYLAAPQSGYLASLDKTRGQRVASGDQVFAVAADPDLQGLQEAEARVGAAQEKVTNLAAPRRVPEVAALEAQWQAARATLALSESQLKQQQALAQARFVSSARLDEAKARRDADAAQVESLRQQIATARSTLGRAAEVKGAQAELAAAEAQAAQRRWQVDKKRVLAPEGGELAETYYRPGEWVPAGAPVASLLPDTRRKLRFYVPETALAQLRPGVVVTAGCDGCDQAISATVDFVAPQAEYTPPVIYSRGAREKLLFRVEARPAPEAASRLRPGLPLEVRLSGGGQP